jgi:uncharacterized protein (TIGR04255 family)
MHPTNPLVAAPPEQVPLAKAPLVRVLAVVRFPMLAEIETPEFAATFQKSVGAAYPLAEHETLEIHTPRQDGTMSVANKTVWRFLDEAGWRASLSRDFLALETKSYLSRPDFLQRFQTILEALTRQVTPARVDRLGVRYIDRIQGQDLADIHRLVRPELAGVANTSLMPQCKHSLTDNLFDLGQELLAARWGLLPANGTPDPSTIEPIPEASWIMDIDMSTSAHSPFATKAICSTAEAFAARIYTFFRWAVTDEFLRRFGGDS